MLQIRSAQMSAFSGHAHETFRLRVATWLRAHLPEHTARLSSQELSERIIAAQHAAETYGVVSERAIAKWAYLSLILGAEFHQQTAINEYLQRDIPKPDTKVDNLMHTLAIRLSKEGKA